jgi:Porin PorA
MRRVAGLVLSALGTFLIVLALLIRFVVASEAVKYPLNENTVTTLIAHNASYFSPAKVAEVHGATLETTLTTQGDNAAGSSGTAVWNQFSYVYDKTNDLTVSYSTQRLAFDRKTGVLENCCGAAIGTNTTVHMSGQGYLWPFNTQKKTYQIFDTTLLKPVPTVYSGTATVDGEATYKFVETVNAQQVGTQTLPGALVGESAASVTLPEYDTSTTTEYVDPITGAPVEGVSHQDLYLENSSGAPVLTLLDANFATTPATIASTVNTARTDDNQIDLVQTVLPLILGIVGVILLVMGLLLVLTGRREAEYYDDEEQHQSGEVSV